MRQRVSVGAGCGVVIAQNIRVIARLRYVICNVREWGARKEARRGIIVRISTPASRKAIAKTRTLVVRVLVWLGECKPVFVPTLSNFDLDLELRAEWLAPLGRCREHARC